MQVQLSGADMHTRRSAHVCDRQTGVDGHRGDTGMVDRDRNIWGKLGNSK